MAFGAVPKGVEPAVGPHPDHTAGLSEGRQHPSLVIEGEIPHVAAAGFGSEDRGAVSVEAVYEAAGRGPDRQVSPAVRQSCVNGDFRGIEKQLRLP